MRLTHTQLLTIYRSALRGAGIAWADDPEWGRRMEQFAQLHQGTMGNPAYQAGRFLGHCVQQGWISRERMLRVVEAEERRADEAG